MHFQIWDLGLYHRLRFASIGLFSAAAAFEEWLHVRNEARERLTFVAFSEGLHVAAGVDLGGSVVLPHGKMLPWQGESLTRIRVTETCSCFQLCSVN
jgi:hypothetical protein